MFGATEQLSASLQGEDTSVSAALTATEMVQAHLKRLRTEDQFHHFYENKKASGPRSDRGACLASLQMHAKESG